MTNQHKNRVIVYCVGLQVASIIERTLMFNMDVRSLEKWGDLGKEE